MSGNPPVRNLPSLRAMPVYGQRLVEAFNDVRQLIKNVAQQTNTLDTGQSTPPPPQINALIVTAGAGIAHAQITDNNAIYRGVGYHLQYSTDSGFSAPVTVPMGPSRDIRVPVGSQPLYYRAFSDYPTSSHSDPVYHGGAIPLAVAATGSNQPTIPSGMGSGTGMPSQISGHGPVPFRGTVAPRRS